MILSSKKSPFVVWGGISLIGLVTYLVFWRVTSFQFVTFDDGLHLYKNPLIADPSLSHLLEMWRKTLNGLYVPMTYTVWTAVALWAKAKGLAVSEAPHYFHTINVILHGVNTCLVFLILRKWTPRFMGPFLGALLFLLHPLQVESVAWISSLTGVLSGFFSLVSIYCFIGWRKSAWRSGYSLSLFFFFFSCLSKPVGIALPLLLLALDFGILGTPFKKAVQTLIPMVILAFALALVAKSQQPNEEIRFITPLLWRPGLLVDSVYFYFTKLLFPFSLSVNYGRTPDLIIKNQPLLLEMILVLGSAIFIWLRTRSKLWVSCLLIFLANLLPTLGLIPFFFQKYSNVSDRFTYLSLFGISLLFCAFISKNPRPKYFALFSLLLAWYAAKCIHQTRYWKDDLACVAHITAVNPTADNHFNLAQMILWESEGKNPVPGTPRRPLAVSQTAEEKRKAQELISYHLNEAMKIDPDLIKGYMESNNLASKN